MSAMLNFPVGNRDIKVYSEGFCNFLSISFCNLEWKPHIYIIEKQIYIYVLHCANMLLEDCSILALSTFVCYLGDVHSN